MWEYANPTDRERLLNFVFPEGLRFNKDIDALRTPRVNEVFALLSRLSSSYKEKTEPSYPENSVNSPSVVCTGIEPVLPE